MGLTFRGLVPSTVLLLSTVVFGLGPDALRADFRDEYKAGVDAFEVSDWATAERHMSAAIAENPEEKSGALVRRYTPHYYLGLAQIELGRCREAIVSLDESERQGEIRARDLETLVARRQQCVDRINENDRARDAAQQVVEEAQAATRAVDRVEASPVLRSEWRSGSNSFASRQSHWQAQIDNARQFLREGDERLDLSRIEEAERIAAEARDQLRSLEADALARRRDLQPVVESRLSDIRSAINATERDIAFVRNLLSPLPSTLVTTLQSAEDAVARAQAADASTPIPELDGRLQLLRQELRGLRAAVQAPPDGLMEAATAYFRGDYGGTLERLDRLGSAEPRVAAHACLFRAAALFALARLDSLADAGVVDDQMATCRDEGVVLVPPADKFPPQFVSAWTRQVVPVSDDETDGG